MNTTTKAQGTQDLDSASGAGRQASVAERLAWHAPKITTLPVQRTMLILGSVIDGVSGSI